MSLESLENDFTNKIQALNGRLEREEITLAEWYDAFARLVARYHTFALVESLGVTELPEMYRPLLREKIDLQLDFLRNRRDVIRADGLTSQQKAYTEMYSKAIKSTYDSGEIIKQVGRMLPLPTMPGEGTQCLSNCKCRWDIKVIDALDRDYDCYWVLGVADHCQTCVEYAKMWNPLKIRGNKVIIPSEMLAL